MKKAVLTRFKLTSDTDEQQQQFIRSLQPVPINGYRNISWHSFHLGNSHYGTFQVLETSGGLIEPISSPVREAFSSHYIAASPEIFEADVLADKLPVTPDISDTKAILLTFKAKPGHEMEVEDFLAGAKAFVLEEPETISWFALKMTKGEYGIFDTFPGNGARFKHLTGHVPRELAKHAFSLLGSIPDLDLIDLVEEKFLEKVLTTSV